MPSGTRKILFEEGVGGLPTKINGALSDAARDFSRVLNFAMSDIGP
jgi:hypothetical protein